MKKLVILGCENSHADNFLHWIYESGEFPNVQVIGLYSEEDISTLSQKYGVPTMKTADEAVGAVDGVIITARHGAKHYEYAKPYISSGVPMYIDKPITVDENEALQFINELQQTGVRVTGGSICKHDAFVQELKRQHLQNVEGKTVGGFVRAPLQPASVYGGFYFYAQHLVEIICEIFGRRPYSVRAKKKENTILVSFQYKDFTINGLYVADSYLYFASRQSENGMTGQSVFTATSEACSKAEFEEYYNLLFGAKQAISYGDFIAPVFIMNAIERSLAHGNTEEVLFYRGV